MTWEEFILLPTGKALELYRQAHLVNYNDEIPFCLIDLDDLILYMRNPRNTLPTPHVEPVEQEYLYE